ncbi:MAG: TldD/PmbA family protein [Candidatus Heimdallarchaeaceae archaeon]
MDNEELMSLSNELVEYALTKDIHAVEVFYEYRKTLQIVVAGHDVSSERSTREIGFGIRVLKGESEGFSYTNKTDKESLEKCVDNAVKMANVVPPKPGVGLPLPADYHMINNLYSEKIAIITPEDIIGYISQITTPFRESTVDLRADLSKVQSIEEWAGIVNSIGVEGSYKANYLEGSFFLIARDGEKVGSFVTDSFFTRDPERVDFTEFGTKLAQRAERNLNAIPAPSIDSDVVIFKPDAVFIPIFLVIASSVSADNVQQNRSFWKDKLADQVASESLSIYDEPHNILGGAAVRPFDDEGVPTQLTAIIKDGILENFLFDTLRAQRSHSESTGNSWRSFQPPRFSNIPSQIFPNAPVIQSSNFSEEQLIEETKLGIIFEYFSGSFRPENGIFSGVAKGAQLIENGEITKPLINVSISGNVFECLNNIEGIGNKLSLVSGYLRTPVLKISGIKIASQN